MNVAYRTRCGNAHNSALTKKPIRAHSSETLEPGIAEAIHKPNEMTMMIARSVSIDGQRVMSGVVAHCDSQDAHKFFTSKLSNT